MKKIAQMFNVAPIFTFMLIIGLVVEGSNFQNLFFSFMQQYRPDWLPELNHILAFCLSTFMLAAIVGFGLERITWLSWFMAALTTVVSMMVYQKVAPLSWQFSQWRHAHFVVLILAVVLPGLMAYLTHLIGERMQEAVQHKDEETELQLQLYEAQLERERLRRQKVAIIQDEQAELDKEMLRIERQKLILQLKEAEKQPDSPIESDPRFQQALEAAILKMKAEEAAAKGK